MSWISDHLLTLNGTLVLIAVFLLPALESSVFLGFVIPGETAVVIGGVTAYNGTNPLWAVLLASVAGAIVGDSIGYAVGNRWGDALLTRIPHKLLKPAHIRQSKDLIARLGGRAVFAGRFAAALRALVPGLCGLSDMRYRTFAVWNMLGGAVWATAFTLIGYFAGASWHRIESYANTASWILVGVIVVAVAGLLYLKHRSEKRASARFEDDPEDGTRTGAATGAGSDAADSVDQPTG
ncbi:DedA family protein [Streptacidiphilus sp. PB12-B1b]|uniref:DedA family protein n=1 Tax=Streptacidiphilus sp. PB12-B1b TaxID=2705012 RepID=UPI0015FB9C74|nr:DedA family protein [Streptacidiphilus sp. PB12-B1b]QMU75244.1 DedA family protein [Streptacidiphilus sp. PB12-B1b]